MTNKQKNNMKKNSPTYANDSRPKVELANKEKGIETIYLKDEHKH